ncbi:MAG: PQQ-binding-like beta-propeller repeat protein [Bordetella sp.]|nr:MAG: PQQ-binding-like beta-propeller repeat protein [Bordetella sp.]
MHNIYYFFSHLLFRINYLWIGIFILSSCSSSFDTSYINKRINFSKDLINLSKNLKWVSSIGTESNSNFYPVVLNNEIYATTPDGFIGKFDLLNGNIIWKISVPMRLTTGPATDGSTIVVISEEGEIFAFNDKGLLKWSKKSKGTTNITPIINNGIVIVQSGNDALQAFDVDNGENLWIIPEKSSVSNRLNIASKMIVIDNLLITGTENGKLLAVDIRTGVIQWNCSIMNSHNIDYQDHLINIIGSPLIIDNIICAAAYKGCISCFDTLNEGRIIWNNYLNKIKGITSDKDFIYSISDDNLISSLSLHNGEFIWNQTILKNCQLTAAPVIIGDIMAISDSEGYLYCISKNNGFLIDSFFLGKRSVISSIVSTQQGFLIQSNDGNLMLINYP